MTGRSSPAARNRSDISDESARATRARLLAAAAEVFAEAGYQQAKVRDICGRAGANIALINYHFGDKLGLYTEVLQQSVKAGHTDAIRSALDQGGPPEDILRALVKARMQGMCRGDQADRQFRIVMHELAQPTPAMERVINEVTRPIYNRMLDLIGGMVSLPAGDEKTRLCVHSVMGQIMLYALAGPFLKRLWPGLKMTPEQLDRIADHIADFSLAYMQAARKDRRKGYGAAARR
jgi:TetR/AcrR family transcriptional regulator, regulator of cefoperazone and chloramphenicol sensitivity